jgi:hypothetical protein
MHEGSILPHLPVDGNSLERVYGIFDRVPSVTDSSQRSPRRLPLPDEFAVILTGTDLNTI